MSKYEWLLFLHMTGAFLFLGAAVAALVFNVASLRREKPSEIALLLRLSSLTVPGFAVGGLLLLVFGLWLVHDAGYGYGEGWVVAALVLFVLSNVLGAVRREARRARELADRLAAEEAQPSAELRAHVRDPIVMFLDYGAALAGFVVLILMIWKPAPAVDRVPPPRFVGLPALRARARGNRPVRRRRSGRHALFRGATNARAGGLRPSNRLLRRCSRSCGPRTS